MSFEWSSANEITEPEPRSSKPPTCSFRFPGNARFGIIAAPGIGIGKYPSCYWPPRMTLVHSQFYEVKVIRAQECLFGPGLNAGPQDFVTIMPQ